MGGGIPMNFPRIQQDPEDVQDYGIERKTRIRRAFPNSPHDSQNPNDYDIICKEEIFRIYLRILEDFHARVEIPYFSLFPIKMASLFHPSFSRKIGLGSNTDQQFKE